MYTLLFMHDCDTSCLLLGLAGSWWPEYATRDHS